MPLMSRQHGTIRPLILTNRVEEILKTIHFYRYMTALDVSHRLFSPSSLTYVRSILSSLAGGEDFKENQYLCRFQLPTVLRNSEKIFSLGYKGREFLVNYFGLPIDWYFRLYKIRDLSHSQILHNLILTRILVAAHSWSAKQSDCTLIQTRICYELARRDTFTGLTKEEKTEAARVIPDGWLLFRQKGKHMPTLLEIDRGTEYKRSFQKHIKARIEYVKKDGVYSRIFNTTSVTVAYITTGETPEYRESRLKAMRNWTLEVLKELNKQNWSPIFRFCSLTHSSLYDMKVFEAPVWYTLDSSTPVSIFEF
jgi:hypothetical protein